MLRAWGIGVAVTAVAVVVVWLLGLLPAATEGMVALGAAAALAAAGLAIALHGRMLDPRAHQGLGGDGRLIASRLQGLMGAALGLKLACVTLGVLALRSSGVKFPQVAAFAIAFAGASLVCQVTAAGSLVRAFSRTRAARSVHGHDQTTRSLS